MAEKLGNYRTNNNRFKLVNQLEIVGSEKRIPDGIPYINGLLLVVFEFKSAISEDAMIHNAFKQLTFRYRRDIPELFKYNAFCMISDGVSNKTEITNRTASDATGPTTAVAREMLAPRSQREFVILTLTIGLQLATL